MIHDTSDGLLACHRFSRSLPWMAIALASTAAHGQAVTAIDTFNFIDNREASVFGPAVELIAFGGDFNPAVGTTVTATQGATVVNVPYLHSPAIPNEFFSTIRFDSSLAGAWTIKASHPADTPFVGMTNPLYSGPLTPFISNAKTDGLTTTPTFSWTQPAYAAPAGTRAATSVFLMNQSGTVLLRASLPQAASTFTVPAAFNGTSLQIGRNYVVSLQTTLFSATSSLELETSRSYFDYAPSTVSSVFAGPISLPEVDPTGRFHFDVDVSAGVPVVLDPAAALGYIFQVGAGDPQFQSVALPTVGDSAYEIDTWDGSTWVKQAEVAALSRYDFAGVGVDQFRVVGIDPAAALDPNDPTAFEASVTFGADGVFTGTMTALTSVPEPPVSLLMGLGLVAAWMRRERLAPN